MLTETERRTIFRASPLLEGFLAVALEDLQISEHQEGREERDTGTIYSCPDETFNRARDICDAFYNGPGGDLCAISDCSFDQLGSDLYLECSGHGAGFQDRDHGDPDIGSKLSEAVTLSYLEMYVGDDGEAYFA